ncbi:tectonic-3-like [Branchiostoma lanceolatum]|uniref:tectonic-3-like n=1 Tax=Branchiostoma lanceolatum TaxID=7740 RepID=UPI003456D568
MAAKFHLLFFFLATCTVLLGLLLGVRAQTTAPVSTQGPTTQGLSSAVPTTPAPATQAPATQTTFPVNTNVGSCTCDLTQNACDVNCCCDTDCTTQDTQTFSQCLENLYKPDDRLCVQDHIIVFENTQYVSNLESNNLFCIYTDNYPGRNYYTGADTVETEQDFQNLVQTYETTSYSQLGSTPTVYENFYKSGDPIYTVNESGAQGTLGLPKADITSNCLDSSVAGFLLDETTSCTREWDSLANQCETNPSLNANIYYLGLKVARTPALFQSTLPPTTPAATGTATVPTVTTVAMTTANVTIPVSTSPPGNVTADNTTNLFDNPDLVNFTLTNITCQDREGNIISCGFPEDSVPRPVYNGTSGLCDNVVLQVTYVMTHNGSQGISAVEVSFTLGSLPSTQTSVQQSFTISFNKQDSVSGFRRSGNPGYVVGEPVLAGTLVETTSVTASTTEQLRSIVVSSDRNSWLSMLSSAADGSCVSSTADRSSVVFGEDMRSGCLLTVFFNNITSVCTLLQNTVNDALLGTNPPSHVAMFGNSQLDTVGDWVEILRVNEPVAQTTGFRTTTCRNVVLGMHIEVLYANIGALSNPQPKILAVRFRFEDPQDITFTCVGTQCQAGGAQASQQFEVVSSVSFIDASTSPTASLAEYPTIQTQLPFDFFYPFQASSAISHLSGFSRVICATAFVIFVIRNR